MKKAFLIGLSLLSLNSHALLERAFFPELTGQITEIQSDKGIKLEDLRVEYVVACSGHKTDSLFGYDNGLQLTNCADDSISYDIQVYEDGTFDLPKVKEFTFEGRAFYCFLSISSEKFVGPHGNPLSHYIGIPCHNSTGDEVKQSLEELTDIRLQM